MSLRISEIFIYPVKSLGGISLTHARVMEKGLEHDRRWMLVDSENNFLTQRVHHRMALFRTELSAAGVRVSYHGDSITIPFGVSEGDPLRSTVWDDAVTVREVSAACTRWFSERMELPCKLVAFPEENERSIDPRYRIANEHVSLADGYPLLVVGQSSVDDLNRRLKTPVPVNRFRPNVVVTGGEPFDEDNWKRFAAGSVEFAGVKLCKRCVLITVDQETGTKGTEPLATLSTYRRWDNGVHFGQNVIPLSFGEISVGNEIVVSV